MSSEIKVNKITSSSGSTLEFGGAGDTVSVGSGATVTGFGGGKVLQVVQSTKSDTASTNSGTAVTTGLEASITPSSTSSKVLVTVVFSYDGSPDVNTVFQLYRDATAIHLGDAAGNRQRASVGSVYQNYSGEFIWNGTINALDTPSSTSSITYKLMYFRGNTANTNSVYFNRSYSDSDAVERKRTISSITLMEIGA